jgi:hypothetical protein
VPKQTNDCQKGKGWPVSKSCSASKISGVLKAAAQIEITIEDCHAADNGFIRLPAQPAYNEKLVAC